VVVLPVPIHQTLVIFLSLCLGGILMAMVVKHIYLDLPVAPWEAVLGSIASVPIPT